MFGRKFNKNTRENFETTGRKFFGKVGIDIEMNIHLH